jgi:hypothetical protein
MVGSRIGTQQLEDHAPAMTKTARLTICPADQAASLTTSPPRAYCDCDPAPLRVHETAAVPEVPAVDLDLTNFVKTTAGCVVDRSQHVSRNDHLVRR